MVLRPELQIPTRDGYLERETIKETLEKKCIEVTEEVVSEGLLFACLNH